MHKNLLVSILLTLLTLECFSQLNVSGTVLCTDTKKPIAFANIGIVGSGIGSISNEDGSFSFPVPDKNLKDSVTFSAIGFGTRKVPIDYFMSSEKIIWLNEKTYTLNEVLVIEKKQTNKIFKIGNRSFRGGVLETDTTYSGRSVALLIEPKSNPELQFPVYVQKASLRILRNNLPSFRFRIRLNEVDSVTGEPSKDILQQSIVMTSSMRNGWLEFDLSTLDLLIHRPFFITFEQIVDQSDRTKIADGYREYIRRYPEKLKIDTILFNGKEEVVQTLRGGIDLPGTFIAINNNKANQYSCFERETSFAEWKKVRGIVTAFATLSTQTKGEETAETVETECSSDECKITTICQNFLEETGMNGMQMAVLKNGDQKFSINLGFADVENQLSMKNDTKLRINSISKSFTATALIRLVEEDKLDLEAPVQQYIGEFHNIKDRFTVRQLAGHLAGIRDYNESDLSDFVRTKHYKTSTEALELIKNDTLLFQPGASFHYSTFGWIIIGAVVEAITGDTYEAFMEHAIFEPLGLKNTRLDDIQSTVPNRSKFYDVAGNENDYGDWSYKYPGAGLLSTAEDMATFGNELLNGNHLNPKMKALLFQSQRTIHNKETGYGMGWYTGTDKRGNRIWYHSGDSFSSSSHLILYPDLNMVISFLGNSQDGAAFDWQMIADVVLDKH